MHSSLPAFAELKQRLEDLPPELYDRIFDLTFAAKSGPHLISQHYKPPVQLQVSRATRQRFAEAYYQEGTVFIMPVSGPRIGELDGATHVCINWLQSLARYHPLRTQHLEYKILFPRSVNLATAGSLYRPDHDVRPVELNLYNGSHLIGDARVEYKNKKEEGFEIVFEPRAW